MRLAGVELACCVLASAPGAGCANDPFMPILSGAGASAAGAANVENGSTGGAPRTGIPSAGNAGAGAGTAGSANFEPGSTGGTGGTDPSTGGRISTGGARTGGRTGTGGASTGGSAGTGGSGGRDSGGCSPDCSAYTNCVAGSCRPAQVDCATQKARYPTSPDGVYWLDPDGNPYVAYCDMQLETELCSEVEGEHQGRTREGSELSYVMTNVLRPRSSVCELWAIRATADECPLDRLDQTTPTMQTCAALGFLEDDSLGFCAFGANNEADDCGFAACGDYDRYGNACSDCSLNEGYYDEYLLQGTMFKARTLSNVDGTVTTRCKVATYAGSPPAGSSCSELDDCETGTNCIAGSCAPAQTDCAAQKARYPSSPDGVYWLSPDGEPYRAYCDMQLEVELCSEIQGEHEGRTREGSELVFEMTSVLSYDSGVCELWAIRATSNQWPLAGLTHVAGETMDTCVALGFLADGALGTCMFGAHNSNCGFDEGEDFYLWGNACGGCTINDGYYPAYMQQGYMYNAGVLSTMDGTVRTRCKVTPDPWTAKNTLGADCNRASEDTGCVCKTFAGQDYEFCDFALPWTEAQAYCQDMGLDLASIRDARENEFLSSTAASIATDWWWAGLNDRAEEGVWVQSDGSPLPYSAWGDEQPDDRWDREDCEALLSFYPAFTWNDAPCEDERRFVCE